MKPITVIAVTLLLFASCAKQEDAGYTMLYHYPTPPTAIDRTTPDRLVKSKWTYDVWENTVSDSLLLPPYLSGQAKKYTMDRRRRFRDKEIEAIAHYEILRVNIESASRAAVLTLERKDSLTYILTNPGDGWLVDDIQQRCFVCGGKGTRDDYEAWERHGFKDPRPQIQCDKCGGRGMMSRLFWE